MDKALLARVEKQALFHRYPRSLPLTLLAIGILITSLFVLNIEKSEAEARRLSLETDLASLSTEIERKTSENAAYLKAAAALFSVSDDVTSAEFSQFIADMSAGHTSRGALGMGWAAWVRTQDIPALERTSAMPDPKVPFKVRAATGTTVESQADHAVIQLLEPASEPNRRAIGFDMYSEPVRRAAMDAAIKSGRPVATGKVHLVQDRGNPNVFGTLIYSAVYGRASAGGSRPMRPKGFIYTPVRVQDLLDTAIIGAHRNTGRVALYDGEAVDANLLAATEGNFNDSETARSTLDFAGRKWTLLVSTHRSSGLSATSWLVLGLGTLISLLLMALAWLVTSRAADDRKVLEWLTRQAALRTSLTRELNHRVKNTLANVLSIVSLTRRRAANIDDFAEGLTGRIRALSATHDLLSQREWSNALVLDVVKSELAPYLDPTDPHAEVSGPDALLSANDAMSLGLALHELSTNAAKYGALSVADGKVSVTWELIGEDRCEVRWREQGGPLVEVPSRRGFGLDLIEKIVSHELEAQVDLRFDPDGVKATIAVPIRDRREFTIREGSVG
ncbi:MAG: CHASE domain-containing protein [Novosphingobium sp.]